MQGVFTVAISSVVQLVIKSCPCILQRAFQAWLDEKEREKQLKLQRQKRIMLVSSLPAWEWEPERNLAKKENKWCGNFGTPAHLLQTNTKTKVKPEKSDEVEDDQRIKLILSD